VNGTFTATGNAGTAAFGGLTFGAAGNLLSFGDVSIAEVIVYARTHTNNERATVRRALGRKYGITVA
jgi:hypothetical protein